MKSRLYFHHSQADSITAHQRLALQSLALPTATRRNVKRKPPIAPECPGLLCAAAFVSVAIIAIIAGFLA